MRDEVDVNGWSKLTNNFFHSPVLLSLNKTKKIIKIKCK